MIEPHNVWSVLEVLHFLHNLLSDAWLSLFFYDLTLILLLRMFDLKVVIGRYESSDIGSGNVIFKGMG